MENSSNSFNEIESNTGRCVRLTKKYFKDRLPILKWFPQYKSSYIFSDAVAGITVGLTAIPQSMAYAGIAGLTPEYGLYSSFVSCFVYIFLGSCRQMTIGPTAVIELLTYETCGQDFASCVILTGFYVGVVQLLMGILHLGLVVSLISEPVTMGFVAGAALTISSSQIKSFFGLDGHKGKGFIGYWESAFKNISTVKLGDTLMGFIAVLLLVTFKNLKDWVKPSESSNFGKSLSKILWFLSISRNALIVIVSSLVAYGWSDPPPFALTGWVKSGFPPVDFPPFELPLNHTHTENVTHEERLNVWGSVGELGTGPLSIAFISILQNVAIAKAFGSGQSIDANQEMISLGVSHITGSFFSAIPTSGSFSRSAVNESSGVRSPFSGIFTGLLVIFALGFLTPSFYFIPKSSLAAVILCAVLPMIEYEALVPMWKVSRLDVLGALVTFVSSLFLGMEYGIMLGVITSLALYLLRPIRPRIEYELLSLNQDIENGRSNDGICSLLLVVKPEEGFAFPNVDFIRSFINKKVLSNPKCTWVALDCEKMIRLDYTAATALSALAKGLYKNGKTLLFLNCSHKTDWMFVFQVVGLNLTHCFQNIDDIYSFVKIKDEASETRNVGKV